MKKLVSILLASVMALSMAACGEKSNDSKSTEKATEKVTEKATEATAEKTETPVVTRDVKGDLLVWLDNDDWAAAVIEAFNAKYPDVTIEYQNVGNVDSRGKVSLDGPAGIGPDVFAMPHDHMNLAIGDGLCEPMPEDLKAKFEANLLDSAIQTSTADGKLYGVPIATENIALLYNKDLWGEKAPASFEEIIEFAKTYNNAAEGKFALKWQVDDSYHNYFWLTAFGMKLFGENMDDYKNPGWDSEAAKKAIDFYRGMRKQVFDVNVADATWDATVASFQRGEAPLTISGPWAIADALKNGVKLGVAKLPTINGVQPRCFAGNIITTVSSYSDNKDAAFAFVEFLGSDEAAAIIYKVLGKLPALKDITKIEGLKDDVYLAGIKEQSPFADPMPLIPEMAQAWDSQKALFTFTWDNTLTTEEAQKKAMETYETLLTAAGKSLK